MGGDFYFFPNHQHSLIPGLLILYSRLLFSWTPQWCLTISKFMCVASATFKTIVFHAIFLFLLFFFSEEGVGIQLGL